jgi:hypothetical protein
MQQAGDGAQGGGLAAAVGAHEGHDLSRRHGQADGVERLQISVEGVDRVELQHQAECPRWWCLLYCHSARSTVRMS